MDLAQGVTQMPQREERDKPSKLTTGEIERVIWLIRKGVKTQYIALDVGCGTRQVGRLRRGEGDKGPGGSAVMPSSLLSTSRGLYEATCFLNVYMILKQVTDQDVGDSIDLDAAISAFETLSATWRVTRVLFERMDINAGWELIRSLNESQYANNLVYLSRCTNPRCGAYYPYLDTEVSIPDCPICSGKSVPNKWAANSLKAHAVLSQDDVDPDSNDERNDSYKQEKVPHRKH